MATSRLQDPLFKNWVRCMLGLAETKESLHSLVESRFNGFLVGLMVYFVNPINLFLCPSLNHNDCKWSTPRQNRNTKEWEIETDCSKNKEIVEKILEQFDDPKSAKIYWNNSDSLKDIPFISSWEIAKVFMPRGTKDCSNPEKTDAAAIVNILNTCKLFFPMDHSLLDKLMNIINKIMHSASNKISKEAMETYLDSMISFLEFMFKKEGDHAGYRKAVENIRVIKDANFIITLQLAHKAVQCKQGALSQDIATHEAEGKDASYLKGMQRQCADDFKQQIEQIKHEAEMLQLKTTLLDNHVQQEKQSLQLLKQDVKSMAGIREDMLKFKDDLAQLDRIMAELKTLDAQCEQENEELKQQIENRKHEAEMLRRKTTLLDNHVKQEKESLQLLKQDVESMSGIQEDLLKVQGDLAQLDRIMSDLKSREEIEHARIRLTRENIQLKKDVSDIECFCLMAIIFATIVVSFVLRVYTQYA